MSSAKQERAEAAAAVLEEVEKMAKKADDLAKWAAQELASARAEALSAARQVSGVQAKENNEAPTSCGQIANAPGQSKPTHVVQRTAAKEVSATTELLEAILECEAVYMRQLFVLRRVSKQFAGTIAGSISLQKKMFLLPDNEDPFLNPLLEDCAQYLKCFNRLGCNYCPEIGRHPTP
ncbi:hypothetical protein B0A48_01257 [Cryoendolithus antarcticus]|uniref:Uncharacterized protein n=1 Tax=Cryoendolithus antarcticus TaxID=1507870 RepID=A0A1V8TSW4_9PEZI|nr:hypothetical protein B0A48_01257 [Cryoendolithus antarcticus]